MTPFPVAFIYFQCISFSLDGPSGFFGCGTWEQKGQPLAGSGVAHSSVGRDGFDLKFALRIALGRKVGKLGNAIPASRCRKRLGESR